MLCVFLVVVVVAKLRIKYLASYLIPKMRTINRYFNTFFQSKYISITVNWGGAVFPPPLIYGVVNN